MNLTSTFEEFKELKNIDRATMMGVLEEVFRNVLDKTYGTDDNFDVIVNVERGDLEIWRNRTVVADDELEDANLEITLSEAKLIDPTYEEGEEVAEEVKMESFPRRAVLAIGQNLRGKILELEKANIFAQYSERIGELVTGDLYQVWKKEALIIDDQERELLLPKTEQIPSDFFRNGDPVRAIVSRVDMING
ncbi:MAG: NusA N-terminal domain-containing protein, partial [Rikenellaceae bacterium]